MSLVRTLRTDHVRNVHPLGHSIDSISQWSSQIAGEEIGDAGVALRFVCTLPFGVYMRAIRHTTQRKFGRLTWAQGFRTATAHCYIALSSHRGSAEIKGLYTYPRRVAGCERIIILHTKRYRQRFGSVYGVGHAKQKLSAVVLRMVICAKSRALIFRMYRRCNQPE